METEGGSVEPDKVARLVSAVYDVGSVSNCRHLFTSVNHTYAIEAGNTWYAVRVHGRNQWWIPATTSADDVRFSNTVSSRSTPASLITTRSFSFVADLCPPRAGSRATMSKHDSGDSTLGSSHTIDCVVPGK